MSLQPYGVTRTLALNEQPSYFYLPRVRGTADAPNRQVTVLSINWHRTSDEVLHLRMSEGALHSEVEGVDFLNGFHADDCDAVKAMRVNMELSRPLYVVWP